MAWPRLRLLLRLRRQALLLLLLSVPVSMSHALRCGALRCRVRGVLAGHAPPSSESSCSLADVSEGTRHIADSALGHHENARPPPPGPIRHNPAGSIRCGPTRPDSVWFGRIRPDPAGFGRPGSAAFGRVRSDLARFAPMRTESV